MAKRTRSPQAQAAAMIRANLKHAYPSVTFKVTSESFSNGDAVDISWTDGPTSDQVNALVRQHQYGHFDGMIDLYEYSNKRSDIPQSKFVHAQRDWSDDAYRAMVAYLNKRYGYALRLIEREYRGRTWLELDHTSDAPRDNGYGWQSHDLHQEFAEMSLLCPHCQAHTLPGDVYCPQCGRALAPDEAEEFARYAEETQDADPLAAHLLRQAARMMTAEEN